MIVKSNVCSPTSLSGPSATRDEQEVVGYADAMQTVFANREGIELTENHIKQLHLELLRYSSKDERHRGEYKTHPNHVEAFDPDGRSLGVVFETATPFETPMRMADLVGWSRQQLGRGDLHPLLAIGVFVATFLAIHPFQDGNGRLSRVLTTLLLLRSGYAYVPYGSLESVIEQNKEGYYLTLRQTQRSLGTEAPDWHPWLTYFLTALQKQKNLLQRKIDRERVLLGSLPDLSARILELAQERGRVTVAEAATANRRESQYHQGPHQEHGDGGTPCKIRSRAGNLVRASLSVPGPEPLRAGSACGPARRPMKQVLEPRRRQPSR